MTQLGDGDGKVFQLRTKPDRVVALEEENALLREALATLVVVEQATGAISARFDTTTDVAFEMMRGLAESQRRDLHEYAAEIVANGGRLTPG